MVRVRDWQRPKGEPEGCSFPTPLLSFSFCRNELVTASGEVGRSVAEKAGCCRIRTQWHLESRIGKWLRVWEAEVTGVMKELAGWIQHPGQQLSCHSANV